MAGEQSAGTFVKVPGETPELLEKHGAQVESVTLLETVDTPFLPVSKPPEGHTGGYRRAHVTLSFPFENVGASLTDSLPCVNSAVTVVSVYGLPCTSAG